MHTCIREIESDIAGGIKKCYTDGVKYCMPSFIHGGVCEAGLRVVGNPLSCMSAPEMRQGVAGKHDCGSK